LGGKNTASTDEIFDISISINLKVIIFLTTPVLTQGKLSTKNNPNFVFHFNFFPIGIQCHAASIREWIPIPTIFWLGYRWKSTIGFKFQLLPAGKKTQAETSLSGNLI
jgi:hypothetical protein